MALEMLRARLNQSSATARQTRRSRQGWLALTSKRADVALCGVHPKTEVAVICRR